MPAATEYRADRTGRGTRADRAGAGASHFRKTARRLHPRSACQRPPRGAPQDQVPRGQHVRPGDLAPQGRAGAGGGEGGVGEAAPRGPGTRHRRHFSFDSYARRSPRCRWARAASRSTASWPPWTADASCIPTALPLRWKAASPTRCPPRSRGPITIKGGRCEQANFNDFQVLRIPEMPRVEVLLVKSDAPPTGVGEPGLPPRGSGGDERGVRGHGQTPATSARRPPETSPRAVAGAVYKK